MSEHPGDNLPLVSRAALNGSDCAPSLVSHALSGEVPGADGMEGFDTTLDMHCPEPIRQQSAYLCSGINSSSPALPLFALRIASTWSFSSPTCSLSFPPFCDLNPAEAPAGPPG